jgi:hypothetical protein
METKLELARIAHRSAGQKLAQARERYEIASKLLKEKIEKLEAERDAMYEKMVSPYKKVEEATEKVVWKVEAEQRHNFWLAPYKGDAEMMMLAKMIPNSRHFSLRDTRIRVINYSDTSVKVCGISEEYVSHAWYFAFKEGKIIAALSVDKAQHRGDYTTAESWGCEEVKKPEGASCYRTGYRLKDFLNAECVKFVGLSAKDEADMMAQFIRK